MKSICQPSFLPINRKREQFQSSYFSKNNTAINQYFSNNATIVNCRVLFVLFATRQLLHLTESNTKQQETRKTKEKTQIYTRV